MLHPMRVKWGLVLAAAAFVAVVVFQGPAAPTPVCAADGKEAKDAATWKEILTEKELESIVKAYVDDVKLGTKSKGQLNSKYKAVMQAGYTLAILGNVGTLLYEKDEAPKAAALREAGLKLAKAAKDKKFDDAKAAVEIIEKFPKKIDPAASGATASWTEVCPIHTLMENVNKIYGDTENATKREPEFKKKAKDLALKSKVQAIFGVVSREHKDKADWKGWCDAMCTESVDLAKQFSSKNFAKAKAAQANVTKSCDDCHKVYREEK